MSNKQKPELIEVRDMPLEEWLALVHNPPAGKVFLNVAFPSDKHHDEYLATIDNRSENDVYRLLYSFLIKSGTIGPFDELRLQGLIAAKNSAPDLYENMIERQYYKRLVQYAAGASNIPPWEGITWVLDLLPHFPKYALEALNAYTLAHIQTLPDWRISGLYDASEVIRAKFIGIPGTNSEAVAFLLNLASRDFECLVERLYDSMGYETELTPPTKDGGRDVIAGKHTPGQIERLLIECKRYSEPVSVDILRALLGVVSSEKVNKGVLATTSRFTPDAHDFANQNPRLELIPGDQLILLMNEHLGTKWPLHIERLIGESQRKYAQARDNSTSKSSTA